MATFPFPFVGAGDATYFEWAEVHVRFVRAPSAAQKKAIVARVPPPIDEVVVRGRDLRAGSDQFAHVHIAEHYGKRKVEIPDGADDSDEGDDDDDDDEEYAGESGFFFAKNKEVDLFNADVEAWLRAAHDVCPILVAFRAEDAESGGTQLSAWHKASVKEITRVLGGFADVLASSKDDAPGAYAARGLLHYAPKAKVGAAWQAWLDPTRDVVAAIQKNDRKAFVKAIGKKPSKEIVQAVNDGFPPHTLRDDKRALTLYAAIDVLAPYAKAHPYGLAADLVVAALRAKDIKRARRIAKDAHPDQLAYVGHTLAVATKPRWLEAIALFDMAIDKKCARTTYNNALYVILRDNNKLPVDKKRNASFLARCLPHGKSNPSIFYNAACVYAEMGDDDKALAHLALALKHGYSNVKQMKSDRVFKTAGLVKDPRFRALF